MINKIIIFIYILNIASCIPKIKEENTCYFPSKIGNKWFLKTDRFEKEINIIQKLKLNDTVYYKYSYKLKKTSILNYELIDSLSRNFCFDSLNNIYESINWSKCAIDYYSSQKLRSSKINRYSKQLIYKFSANIGENWTALGVTEGTLNSKRIYELVNITLESKNDSVVTPKTVYTNCYRFYFEFDQSRDLDYYEWFAPNIGIVKSKLSNSQAEFILTKMVKL